MIIIKSFQLEKISRLWFDKEKILKEDIICSSVSASGEFVRFTSIEYL